MGDSPNTPALSDSALQARVEILRQSQLFIGTSDHGVNADKQLIALVLAGMKPVAEVSSGHWVQISPTRRRTAPDEPEAIATLLHQLGLTCRLLVHPAWTTAVVSYDPDLIRQFCDPTTGHEAMGLLLGYPATACRAFAGGTSLSRDKQTELLAQRHLPDQAMFRLSSTHAQEELAVWQRWHDTLIAVDMVS